MDPRLRQGGAWGNATPVPPSDPFAPGTPRSNAAAFGADVQTTFMPHAEATVPAVPGYGAPTSFGAPPAHGAQAGGTVPAVPIAAQQQPGAPPPGASQSSGFKLPFMNSTAVPAATGTIGGPARGGPAQGSVLGPPPGVAPSGASATAAGGPGQPPGGGAGGNRQDTQPLLRERPQEDYSKYAFYNVRRYRPYFDVDTKEVLWRVGNSFIGAFRANFMLTTQERPDLYGPFWIATTLIFVTAVAGNYAQYLEWRRERNTSPSPPPPGPPGNSTAPVPTVAPAPPGSPTSDPAQWFNDYAKLAASTGIFYGYVFGLSLLLWLVMRYMRADMKLVNMFCIYGYAMTIFIPVSLACIIPIQLMRWLLVMGSALVSGLFLLLNLRERILPAGPGKAYPMLILVLALHLGLGLALKLYFFSY